MPSPPDSRPALLPAIERLSGGDPHCAVIWLHGLGADGHDFEPIVDEFDLARLPPTRFVFPHAPMRPVTINGGYVMRAWYDVVSADFSSGREEANQLRESAARISALITRENERGIPDRRIVLAGFSQGGVLALHAGLRHPRRLAGVVALSCYLPLPDTLAAEAAPENADLPLFIAHGRADPVIPYDYGASSARLLKACGYPVHWHAYQTAHGVCADELQDIESWLAVALGEAG
ncbi:alpha/beta hydrolase [Accumulibacter sp.]|uniref:alpha/beta hydrolase n=1 Tax=Accumulibacter sp. TaxID=2053492 RepID=UPI0025F3AA46|nr:alpha/beta hydrolase-fold protein [Accumulibacter sp.]MCM8596986.1 alpha/beta hydrolase [Accumulibacter sp.]MCM8625222.1 alpha/beta hydrolase [Accumulibacter sp.]MDS4051135.1 alpha/beta hydrolase-fold protein [Accumulibacter sp.]